MIEARSAARRLGRSFQVAAIATALLALAPAARAQGLFTFLGGGPSPQDIAQRLDAAGYALTGPLMRRGDVYLADVVVMGRRDAQRLVIDAETGRIVERYRVQPARWRDTPPQAWNSDEDAWNVGPRPPVDLDRPAPNAQVAREENPALGTGAPRTTGAELIEQPDKPKPKPHEVRRKSAPLAKTPAPSPTPQSDASAGPAATAPLLVTPPARPTVTPAPVAHTAKSEPGPSTVTPPSTAAPNVTVPSAATPTAATPVLAPSATVTAKTDQPAATKSPSPAADAADAKGPSKPKAVNDIPVTPLD